MRKFYKQIIQIELLSEDVPFEWDNLVNINDAMLTDWSGKVEEISCDEVTPEEMAKLLIAQDSDPEFFGLDENGKDMYDEAHEDEEQ